MNHSTVKVFPKSHFWLLTAGPALVVFSLFLLIVKQSPLYIDLSLAAILGLSIASRLRWIGFICASASLTALLVYQYFFEIDQIHFWEIGLAAAIEISFFITALANIESVEKIKTFSQNCIDKVEQFESDLLLALKGNSQLEVELTKALEKADLKEKEVGILKQIVQISKEELLEERSAKEKTENDYYEEKRKNAILEEQLLLFQEELNVVKLASSEERARLLKESEKNSHELILATTQIQNLTEQLDELTDRLKNLQSEKDELEKQLSETLQPIGSDSKEARVVQRSSLLRQAVGLYTQLREQFEEKKSLLEKTRKELFLANEKILLLEKLQIEEEKLDRSHFFANYARELQKAHESILGLESEIADYEDLVTSLSC